MAKQRKFSFTSRKTFRQCEFKYYHIEVLRDCKNAQNSPALAYGNDIHHDLETAMVRNRGLPARAKHTKWALEYVRQHPGLKFPERFLSVDRELNPCDGRTGKAFNTAKVDSIALRVADADVFDYKTGKHSNDMTQMQDTAVTVFAHFPTVVQVTGHLIFTEHEGLVETAVYRREHIMDYVAHWYDIEDDVHECQRSNNWNTTPSGLCPYCPVTMCNEHPSKAA